MNTFLVQRAKETCRELIDDRPKRRAAIYPTSDIARLIMCDAYGRMMDLGWKTPIYPVPADRWIEYICPGSPLVHEIKGPLPEGVLLWREKD
jgi:hypothetical protein